MNRDRRGYYYRSRRIAGKVTREYIGKGPLARAAAAVEARERQQKAQLLAVQRADMAHLQELNEQVAAVCEATDTIMKAVLRAAGYHQHARGQWRKKRNARTNLHSG